MIELTGGLVAGTSLATSLVTLASVAVCYFAIKEILMASKEEVLADLAGIQATQAKVAGEIAALKASSDALQGTIASLEEALANATGIPDDVVAAVAAVKAGAQALDDAIPDLPPVEEPPAEPTP